MVDPTWPKIINETGCIMSKMWHVYCQLGMLADLILQSCENTWNSWEMVFT